jgi:hypothetical protein
VGYAEGLLEIAGREAGLIFPVLVDGTPEPMLFPGEAYDDLIEVPFVATARRAPAEVPALIADLGEAANWRYVEFFTANINNDHSGEPMRAPAAGFSPGAKIAGSRSRPFGRSTSRPG